MSVYGGVDYSQDSKKIAYGSYNPKATYVVVTIILAIKGDSTKIPAIRSMNNAET